MSLSAKQRAFLAAYGQIGAVATAAKTANIARKSHYKWLSNAEYQAAFTEAREDAIGYLEAEAHKRAKDGVETPVIWQGQLCFEPLRNPKTGAVLHDRKGRPLLSKTPLTINRKSDAMLMFVLKKLDPSYRDNYVPVQRAAPPQIKVIFSDRDGP